MGLWMEADMRFILLAFLFLSLSAHSQPASFGFLTYKNSTLTLFTPASPNEIKTITAQTLGGQQACCITLTWRGALKITASKTVSSEEVPVYAYEIPASSVLKNKASYMGQVVINLRHVQARRFRLQGVDRNNKFYAIERCLTSEGIHLYPSNGSHKPEIYYHLDHEIELQEIGAYERACQ